MCSKPDFEVRLQGYCFGLPALSGPLYMFPGFIDKLRSNTCMWGRGGEGWGRGGSIRKSQLRIRKSQVRIKTARWVRKSQMCERKGTQEKKGKPSAQGLKPWPRHFKGGRGKQENREHQGKRLSIKKSEPVVNSQIVGCIAQQAWIIKPGIIRCLRLRCSVAVGYLLAWTVFDCTRHYVHSHDARCCPCSGMVSHALWFLEATLLHRLHAGKASKIPGCSPVQSRRKFSAVFGTYTGREDFPHVKKQTLYEGNETSYIFPHSTSVP